MTTITYYVALPFACANDGAIVPGKAVECPSAEIAILQAEFLSQAAGNVGALIGRLGSSAFRLSTTTVSMSLAGSCFSSESAPRPFHHGIRRRGGTIFGAALPSYRQ